MNIIKALAQNQLLFKHCTSTGNRKGKHRKFLACFIIKEINKGILSIDSYYLYFEKEKGCLFV